MYLQKDYRTTLPLAFGRPKVLTDLLNKIQQTMAESENIRQSQLKILNSIL